MNLDVSVYKNGFHGDMNETFFIGNVDDKGKFLVENTYKSLMKAIDHCRPGNMYRELGNIISKHCEPLGLSVVRSY